MYKLFLTLRYLAKARIAYFAIGAVTLCVAMVLIVMSVMGGWLEMVRQRARGLLGDVIVDNRSYLGFPLYDRFIHDIEDWPEIVQATPVIYSYGLLRIEETKQTTVIRVVGIRLNEVFRVNNFKQSLFYEQYYPGTDNLGEVQQAMLGVEAEAPLMKLPNGQQYPRLVLPPPYQQALEQAQKQYADEHGGALLRDPNSTETDLNKLLREAGRADTPGLYELDPNLDPGFVGKPAPGLILGRDIVALRESDGTYKRYYPRGIDVNVTVIPTTEAGTVDTPAQVTFRYIDDSRTGIYEIDSQHVYCDFELLQKLLLMDESEYANGDKAPARASQIQIKLAPGVDPWELTARLEKLYRGYLDDPALKLDMLDRRLIREVDAMTWQESQAHIIAPVEKEKVLVTILFGIISLVAVALVLCILYMIVLQKTRDIGIIKALGGSSGGVAAIFVLYGAAVGVVGSILGTTLGTVFVWYINDLQDFLISINPRFRVWDLKVYSFDQIPNQVDPVDAITIIIIAILAATVGSLAAAWRAGSMEPVEAIRYE